MTHSTHDAPAPAPTTRPRRRWPRIAAITAVVSVGFVVAVQARATLPPTALARTSGERAPSIRLPDLVDAAQTVELSDVAGRPVVLNFWASWCVPCRREMPAFQAVHERLGDQVAFLGVNHQDSRSDALALLAETGVTYPSGHDPQGNVARAYGLFGMPTTVFISPDGDILARRTGEMSADELRRTIDELLLNR